jgi:exoribonuclease R
MITSPLARTLLAEGFRAIRAECDLLRYDPSLPPSERDQLMSSADHLATVRARRRFDDRTLLEHRFVTLDPRSSTDLDQAFSVERDGNDIVLHYAIADVDAFVDDDDAIDQDAWRRGLTLYAPDGKVPLYPTSISQFAASLLPKGPRPAIDLVVVIGADGAVQLRSAERVCISSQAKLAYEDVEPVDLGDDVIELARRIRLSEDARGAARVDLPEQEIVDDPSSSAGIRLAIRPRRASEDVNAAMSLAANLAVADVMKAAGVGLFRVMPEPDQRAQYGLRKAAQALGVPWPESTSLRFVVASLDPSNGSHVAFAMAARRAGGGASYATFTNDAQPWHAAMAATYAHATAPMRRLADRYVLRTVGHLLAGESISQDLAARMDSLPEMMDRQEAIASKLDRSALDLVEAVTMVNRIGEQFEAVVVDTNERGCTVQIVEPPVRTRLDETDLEPGATVKVRVASVDTNKRRVELDRVR